MATIIDRAPLGPGFDIIAAGGQSNCVGYGTTNIPALDNIPDARIQQWPTSGPYLGQAIPALEPLYHDQPSGSGAIGHVLPAAREYANIIPANRKVLIVPGAHGSTPVIGDGGFGTWDITVASPQYKNLAFQLRDAVLAAKALAGGDMAGNNRIVALFWHQGEADATGNRSQAAYAAALDALFGMLRTAWGLPALPITVGQMLPEGIASASNAAARQAINAAHIDTPRRLVNVGFWRGATGYVQDDAFNHYNAAGQRVNGQTRVLPAFLRARTNVLGTAPVPPSTVTVTQTAAGTLTVTWPQPGGRVTDYNVQTKVGTGAWTTVPRAQNLDIQQVLTGFSNGDSVLVQVRTVNEQGNSVWTASATPVVVTAPPAKVTGLAAGTPTPTTQPLTWTAVAGATGYNLLSKKTSDTTFTTTVGSVTGNSGTVTGLNPATSYDYAVAAVGAGGVGTSSDPVTRSTAAALALCDTVGATTSRAMSTARRLVGAYTGPLFRVRNGTTNTETDIGFDPATGLLDETALGNAANGADLFLSKLYDQSGNGFHRVQATTTKQAKVAAAGVINKISGRAYATFDGVDDSYPDTTNYPLYASGAGASACAVMRVNANPTATCPVVGENNTTAIQPAYFLIGVTTAGKATVFVRDDANAAKANVQVTTIALTSTGHSVIATDTGSSVSLRVDSTLSAATSYTRTATTINQSLLGYPERAAATGDFNGDLAEAIAWTTALSTDQVATIASDQKNFYSTP